MVKTGCAWLLPAGLAVVFFTQTARADEGMWLFNQFPAERVAAAHGFQVTGAFLDHLRLSSVRLNNGGSGSFVSPRGLLFTNHHVAADCIQKVGSAQHDYMRDGFYAAREADEARCPDLEVNVLLRLETVTDRVKKAITPGASPEEANRERRAAIARIEKECADGTRNRCDVVTLFSGERYDLYQYKKYTDLRLVFAPEFLIATFGGDPDNFTFPRYDLDVSFFRAYENGKPASTPEYLRWSREGVKDGELIFLAGNPGSTSRLETAAQLAYQRDTALPVFLDRLSARLGALRAFAKLGEENRRIAHDLIFPFENSFKAVSGELEGLRDPALMARIEEQERKLQAAVARTPALQKEMGGIWEDVARAYREFAPHHKRYMLLDYGPMGSSLFTIARMCLRLPVEKAKPNAERLAAYRDSALDSLALRLYSPAPVYDSMEILILTEYLREMEEWLGPNDPVVKAALAGRTPKEAAAHYVGTSRLKDVAERRRLAADAGAGAASTDGMMTLLRILDAPARAARKLREDTVEAVDAVSAAKIAKARLAVDPGGYPDATFTPRVSYGPVKGYRDKAGRAVPAHTTIAGLYARATGEDPYRLPPRWVKGKDLPVPATPLNFVTTADITGGNSGSPTVNTRGEVVGIVFDGNIESLPLKYFYDDLRARAVHVAGQGIIEALRKLYRTDALVRELLP